MAGLSAAAISAALEQSGVPAADVSEVIMGCVLPANLGQAPARQAALAAGLPASAGATTINKVCGSGMKAIMLGHDLIKAGSASVVVAGGMESMTNAPHLIPNSRTGNRYGGFQAVDHMAWDGLTNPYDGKAMGVFAENCADKYTFTREEQDAYAIESVKRAQAAIALGGSPDARGAGLWNPPAVVAAGACGTGSRGRSVRSRTATAGSAVASTERPSPRSPSWRPRSCWPC